MKNQFRALLSLLLLLLLLTSVASAQFSKSEKIKTFDKVWNTIDKKYYDPHFNGVNWNAIREIYRPRIEAAKDDAEVYTILKQMVGELRDIHTSFRTPSEVQAAKRNLTIGVGLWLGEAEGKTVIFSVVPDSEAEGAGLRIGLIVSKIDGRNIAEILAEKRAEIKSSSSNAVDRMAYARLLSGAENTPVRLSLQEPNELVEREVTLVRRAIKPSTISETQFFSRLLPSGVGYIRFDEFDFKALKQFKKALTEFKDTRGLIIDLRFNRGGYHYAMSEMAAPLFAEKVSFGKTITRTGKIPKFLGISLIPKETFVGEAGEQRYAAPIVILMSNYSASSAEHFAAGMQESRRAKVVGGQSCGCMLGIMGKTKINGGELYVSQFDFVTAGGKRIEQIGVMPDLTVVPTAVDAQSGFTKAVNEAENLLISSQN
ncbi:MAG TPA: S41 family peptidase [Pyrinomonadaceae bacterium]|nr:S41 family peptidase [Pyrinomonadaceae bacterium]